MYKTKKTTVMILLLFIMAIFTTPSARETLVPVYGLLMSQDGSLSDSQKTLVKYAGYPQQFIKNFDFQNGQKRVNETWVYASLGVVESFINGQLVEEKTLSISTPVLAPGVLHPEDYQFNDSQEKILAQHGTPLSIKEEQVWNGSLVTYIYSNIIFGFNLDGLKSVVYYTNQ